MLIFFQDRAGRSLSAPGGEYAGRPLTRTTAAASLSQPDHLRRQAVDDRAACAYLRLYNFLNTVLRSPVNVFSHGGFSQCGQKREAVAR